MQGQSNFPLHRLIDIEQHPEDYRLMERIPWTKTGFLQKLPCKLKEPVHDDNPCTMIVLDLETTGLEFNQDCIIELGMVKATFSLKRKILLSIDASYDEFEDPKRPLSPEITKLTGITDEMVKDQSLDEDRVASFMNGSIQGRPLVIAHNAAFDRPFFEKRFPLLADKSWACTMSQINWRELGKSSVKLELLNSSYGYFYDAHRAVTDCLATLWLLYKDNDAFKTLIDAAKTPSYRIEVRGKTFDIKDDLKARGARFAAKDNDKYWYFDRLTKEENEKITKVLFSKGISDSAIKVIDYDAKTRFKYRNDPNRA